MPHSTSSLRYVCVCVQRNWATCPVSLILSCWLSGAEEIPRQHTGESLRCHLWQGPSREGGNPGAGKFGQLGQLLLFFFLHLSIDPWMLNTTLMSSRRTGLSMMVALLPLRLLTTGSSCSTPSSERNLAAASPCIVWQDLAGKRPAASISINWHRTLVIVPERAGVDIYIPAFPIQFCVWVWGMIVACEHIFPARVCQAFSCTCDFAAFPYR